jgi:hypothetical protein
MSLLPRAPYFRRLQSASERSDSKWDMAVFKERAKEKDHARYEKAKEHEEAAKKGAVSPFLPLAPCRLAASAAVRLLAYPPDVLEALTQR